MHVLDALERKKEQEIVWGSCIALCKPNWSMILVAVLKKVNFSLNQRKFAVYNWKLGLSFIYLLIEQWCCAYFILFWLLSLILNYPGDFFFNLRAVLLTFERKTAGKMQKDLWVQGQTGLHRQMGRAEQEMGWGGPKGRKGAMS